MFTKEERLFIWKKVYEMIDRLEDGEYICVALRNVVFMYFKTHIEQLVLVKHDSQHHFLLLVSFQENSS